MHLWKEIVLHEKCSYPSLMAVRWFFIVDLIFITPMTHDVEHLPHISCYLDIVSGFSEGKLKLRRAYSSSSPSPTPSSPRMSQCFSSSLKAGRKPMSKLEGSQEFSLAQLLFCLGLLDGPTHITKGNVL